MMSTEEASNWEIRLYQEEDKTEWNAFLQTARNSTFLFDRGFMDYHSDRFDDCSLMAYRNGKLKALLPADRREGILRSHGGLTYGGWVLPAQTGIDGNEVLRLWSEWLGWCDDNGISSILYKPLPYIYARQPAQEDLYCLFRYGGILKEVNLSSAISLRENPGFNKLQKRHLKGVSEVDYEIKTYSGEIPAEKLKKFYEMLEICLAERHEARAVHSLSEIDLLSRKFPENISLNVVETGGRIEAGIWLFKTATCNHCQYIATTGYGREKNLMTPLTAFLIEKATSEGKLYFDFGISNEEQGRYLNEGLHRHKSSFGASGVAYTQWEIHLSSSSPIR